MGNSSSPVIAGGPSSVLPLTEKPASSSSNRVVTVALVSILALAMIAATLYVTTGGVVYTGSLTALPQETLGAIAASLVVMAIAAYALFKKESNSPKQVALASANVPPENSSSTPPASSGRQSNNQVATVESTHVPIASVGSSKASTNQSGVSSITTAATSGFTDEEFAELEREFSSPQPSSKPSSGEHQPLPSSKSSGEARLSGKRRPLRSDTFAPIEQDATIQSAQKVLEKLFSITFHSNDNTAKDLLSNPSKVWDLYKHTPHESNLDKIIVKVINAHLQDDPSLVDNFFNQYSNLTEKQQQLIARLPGLLATLHDENKLAKDHCIAILDLMDDAEISKFILISANPQSIFMDAFHSNGFNLSGNIGAYFVMNSKRWVVNGSMLTLFRRDKKGEIDISTIYTLLESSFLRYDDLQARYDELKAKADKLKARFNELKAKDDAKPKEGAEKPPLPPPEPLHEQLFHGQRAFVEKLPADTFKDLCKKIIKDSKGQSIEASSPIGRVILLLSEDAKSSKAMKKLASGLIKTPPPSTKS